MTNCAAVWTRLSIRTGYFDAPFVKYVSDRYKGESYADIIVPEGGSFDDMIALKGKDGSDGKGAIGEGIDKIIAKLAEANGLRNVIDIAKFNDDTKLGKGKEQVDKLTDLVASIPRNAGA